MPATQSDGNQSWLPGGAWWEDYSDSGQQRIDHGSSNAAGTWGDGQAGSDLNRPIAQCRGFNCAAHGVDEQTNPLLA